jgi:hypothetical protein
MLRLTKYTALQYAQICSYVHEHRDGKQDATLASLLLSFCTFSQFCLLLSFRLEAM